jgi:predicted transposase YdaD
LVAQLVYVLKNTELSSVIRKNIINNFKNTVDMNAFDEMVKEIKQEGRQEGRQEEKTQFATSLIISTDFDDVKIASLVDVPLSFVKNLRKSLT